MYSSYNKQISQTWGVLIKFARVNETDLLRRRVVPPDYVLNGVYEEAKLSDPLAQEFH